MTRTLQYLLLIQEQNQKISQILSRHRFSRQNISELRWQKDSILLDGIPARMNQTVKEGQILTVIIREQKSSDQIPAKNLPFSIVYEDEDLIVVNKPAGMPSQPSWYYEESSLANSAAYYWQKQGMGTFVYRCVNRLDKDTSGLLILAKHAIASSILNSMHQTGELVRTYYAIVEEETPLKTEGRVELPIGKDESAANRYQIDFENGLPAQTHYRKIQSKEKKALLEIHIATGRTHQIRVHMSAIGHPLIGDSTYNPNSHMGSRQALHAGKLQFPHPITGDTMSFQSDLADDIRDLWTKL